MAGKSKSLSKNGIYYLIYNVLNIAFPFFTGIYVARKLFPASIGTVTAAQNLAQYFVILAFLGIPTYGMREIAKTRNDEKERSRVFSELYIINLISTVFFLSIYCILVFTIPAYKSDLVLYLIVGISIALNAFNISWLYEGLEEFRFISLRNIIFKCFAFLCLVLLVKSPKDIYQYAAITVIGTAGNYIVNMLYAPRFVTFRLNGINLKRHMKSIIYLVAVNLAIEIYSLMDITMMNFLCNKESIAYYRYGHSIQKMLLQVVNTFTMVLVPRISFYYKEGKIKEFNQLISKALKLIFIVATPMIVGIFFTSDSLITKLYGLQYINSATILKMFSTLLLISPIGYLLGSRILLVTDHENKMIISVGIGAVVNLLGNGLLIPLYSEFGATIASIISEIVVMIVYVNFGRKYYHLIHVNISVIKVLISCLFMGGYLFLLNTLNYSGWAGLIIQVFGAMVIYCLSMIIVHEEVTFSYVNQLIKKI